MNRYTKNEFELLLKERFPNLTKQQAIDKMKKEYAVVVCNRQKSKKKSYMVRESF